MPAFIHAFWVTNPSEHTTGLYVAITASLQHTSAAA